ncbi:MAG: mycothiol synthase [Cellulomonadaceae bacterium]|jgi:mycothiol synthase|nr:mycothiol synthase [Cellulomonadaceae bacterium]
MRIWPPVVIGIPSDDDAAAIRRMTERAAEADRVTPLSEQPLLNLQSSNPLITHATARTKQGRIVGYLQCDKGGHDASAELVVDPEHRHHGIGTLLLRTAERDVAIPAVGGTQGQANQRLRVWAHGNIPEAQRFATHHGYSILRELLIMEADLTADTSNASHANTPQTHNDPEGFTFRTFVPGRDDNAWLACNGAAFAHHPEQGRLTATDLQQRVNEPWFDAAGFFLAVHPSDPTAIAGFCWTKIEPTTETDPATASNPTQHPGEIYAIGVHPDAQGHGLGPALLHRGLTHIASRTPTAKLYVEGTNAAALRLYARCGFTVSTRDVQYGREE